ncbi:MAG: class I SAM-dependent methyltransferase [Alphaproteobacteria bacterium]|nr:class I SAM-dependent methyltransferase [Alphaproteobacteria bacterium]
MRRLVAGLVLGVFAAGAAWAAPVARKPYLAAALADPGRAADRPIDARRRPGELLAFSGVKPGDKVVDLIPGSGYFTRIFAKVVGPKGHVYDVWPNEYAREAARDVVATKGFEKTYGNVTVLEQPAADFSTPEPVDLVFTSQNYHDYPDKFMGKVDPVAFDRQVYKALKPGGVFVVIDHVAQAGSGMRDTDTLHRIDPAIVKKQVTSVGFVFTGQSEVLRNPADDHTKVVFDKSIRGHTDQFVYRFRKPGQRRR